MRRVLSYLSCAKDCFHCVVLEEGNLHKIPFPLEKDFLRLEEEGKKFHFYAKEGEHFYLQTQEIEEVGEKNFEIIEELYPLYRDYLLSYYQKVSTKKQEAFHHPFLENVLLAALHLRASDIHLEAFESIARLRYRIDGDLRIILEFLKEDYQSFLSQIKIAANLDIVEKRLPQDGSFSRKIEDRNFDFRVSVLPTIYGEKLVLRILERDNHRFQMEDLGFSKEQLEKIQKILARSSGLIINAGPTGAGKSSTLFSMLRQKQEEDINIVTVEDPVEYHLYGVNQVECNAEIGLDFSTILRSLLRQDPDVILLGEIRDKETADLAIRSALTGHLVLSTLHARDSLQCFERLSDLGVDLSMLASCLEMLISQRLVKKLCSHCSLPIEDKDYLAGTKRRGRGCSFCHYTGYLGRIAVYEVLFCQDLEKKKLFSKDSFQREELSFLRFPEVALAMARKGEISYEEFMKEL